MVPTSPGTVMTYAASHLLFQFYTMVAMPECVQGKQSHAALFFVPKISAIRFTFCLPLGGFQYV
jgi:hypothetical protein